LRAFITFPSIKRQEISVECTLRRTRNSISPSPHPLILIYLLLRFFSPSQTEADWDSNNSTYHPSIPTEWPSPPSNSVNTTDRPTVHPSTIWLWISFLSRRWVIILVLYESISDMCMIYIDSTLVVASFVWAEKCTISIGIIEVIWL
jgi:hypothetical protein